MKNLPKWVKTLFVTFAIGLVIALILSFFRIDLNTLWRNVMMLLILVGTGVYFYKDEL